MQSDFAGANRVLEPHEYQAFQEHALQALDEGGLGWSTTAGADVAYFKTDPTIRSLKAMQITEKMKSDQDIGAKGNYAILQSMYTLGEDEDIDDLVDRLTYQDAAGNEVKPSAEVIATIQRMAIQPSYDDFITNLNAYPGDSGDLIRAELITNPNTAMIFNNLNQNVKAMQNLDDELSGINQVLPDIKLNQFVSNISGVTNKQALFGLYDQFTSDLDPSMHEPFFNAMEAELGGIDLGDAYMEHKGFAGGGANYTQDELDQLKYQQDFGEFQLESLGEEGVSLLERGLGELDQEELERMSNVSTGIQPRYEATTESVNESLQKLDRIARMTDLSSQAYEEYLKQIEE